MANNKKKNNKNKTLNNVKSELSKKKRGNPNFVKKQNEIIKEVEIKDFEISDFKINNSEIKEVEENKEEIIETMPTSDQIINDNNENSNNNETNENNENNEVDDSDEANDNIVITNDDYGDDNDNNADENFNTIGTSQKINNKKERNIKKNSSLYELLSRPSGATMEELEKELNWKKASIRGTISNLQKEQQFCLITINVIKPNLNLNNKSFYKETHYFIKDCEFNLFNDLLNNLPNPEMASIPAC